jgi:hypothetical protein
MVMSDEKCGSGSINMRYEMSPYRKMSSTRKIISAASDADNSTWRFNLNDSVTPLARISAMSLLNKSNIYKIRKISHKIHEILLTSYLSQKKICLQNARHEAEKPVPSCQNQHYRPR